MVGCEEAWLNIYECVIFNELFMATLCEEMYDKINFPFLYRFYNYNFAFTYVNTYIMAFADKLDIENNEQKKLTASFRINVKDSLLKMRADLIKSLNFFEVGLLNVLKKEILILILVYAKVFEEDNNWGFKNVMDSINVYTKANGIEILQTAKVEHDLHGYFYGLSKALLKQKPYVNKMNYDNLIIYFVNEMTDLPRQLKEEFMLNLGTVYSHFDNWENDLDESMKSFKRFNQNQLVLTCKDQKEDSNQLCRKGSDISPFVYTACPNFTTKSENGLCLNNCPTGFTDHGMYCKKPNAIVKKIHSSAEGCDPNLGCVKLSDILYIDMCPKLFNSVSIICFPKCPYGSSDEGNSCKKRIVAKMTYFY